MTLRHGFRRSRVASRHERKDGHACWYRSNGDEMAWRADVCRRRVRSTGACGPRHGAKMLCARDSLRSSANVVCRQSVECRGARVLPLDRQPATKRVDCWWTA